MRTSIVILILLIHYKVTAQQYPRTDVDLSKITDEIIGAQDGDLNYEELYENFMQLLLQPVDLNKVSVEELRQLHLLREDQINNLISHREENGSLLSLYELQSIAGFTVEDIQRIAPFVVVCDPTSGINKGLLTNVLHEKNNYLLIRFEKLLEEKQGFHPEDAQQKFQGTALKRYMRYRVSSPGNFSAGFTLENDAGEAFHWNTGRRRYGFDYLSYHIQLQHKGRLKNIILGNYQCQFGQGLTLGGVFGTSKGAETVTTTRKSNIGFLPYTSSNETGYFNGVALTYHLTKDLYLSGFFSKVYQDATVAEDGASLSSLGTTGLHRNNAEVEKRKLIPEENKGVVLQYQHKLIDTGIILHHTMFDTPIERNPTLYNQFSFRGNHNANAGLYLNYAANNFTFFSEAQHSLNHGYGFVAGFLSPVHRAMDIALIYRKYQRDFYSFYGNAFAENSQPQNESGVYWGWKYSFSKKYVLAGYTDMFKFPWLKYRNYAPSSGYEWFIKFTYQPAKAIVIFIQARQETKSRNINDDVNVYQTLPGIKNNYTLQAELMHDQRLKLKTRIQASEFSYNHKRSSGALILQDISYTFSKFQVTARHAIFHTDNYDNRMYAYENDVWLAYSLPAYDGTGVRNYIILEYKVHKRLSLWLRYARTRYIDQSEIGTGLDMVNGNLKSDIKIQCVIRV